MSLYYILNDDKTVSTCSFIEHLMTFKKPSERVKHVADEIINKKRISTVFLNINHNLCDEGEPLLFETMVFSEGNWSEIYCERYSTWQEAEEGHKRAVEWVKNGCKEEIKNDT